MTKWFDPELSIENIKRRALEERYDKFIAIMREKGIYRAVHVKNFTLLRNEFVDLIVYYMNHDDQEVFFNFSVNNGSIGRFRKGWTCCSIDSVDEDKLTDDEFVKIVKRLDELLKGEFSAIIDKLYSDVDDKTRLASLKAKLA